MGEGAGRETVLLIRGRPVVTPEQTCPVDLFLSPEILNLVTGQPESALSQQEEPGRHSPALPLRRWGH